MGRRWITWEPPNPSLEEVWRQFGGPGVSDEELVLRVFGEEEAVKAMQPAGPPKEYPDAGHPAIALLKVLTGRTDRDEIRVQREGISLTLKKRNSLPRELHNES